MRLSFDPRAQAGYMKVSNASVARTVEIDDDLVMDLAVDGSLVGVEVLFAQSEADVITQAMRALRGTGSTVASSQAILV